MRAVRRGRGAVSGRRGPAAAVLGRLPDRPITVEFWQGRQHRLHDRFRYDAGGDGWRVERLSPVAGRLRSPWSDDDDAARADRRRHAAHHRRSSSDWSRIPSMGYPGYDPAQRPRVAPRRPRTSCATPACRRPPARARRRASRRLRPDRRARRRADASCSTPTTTCSRRVRSTNGTRRRSSRSSGTGACTGAGRPTTSAASSSTPPRSGAARRRRPARHDQGRRRGRGGVLHRAPPELVRGNADLLRADVAVIADGGNYRTGVPR